MGRCDYEAIGHGFTEREALQDAIEQDRDENGHQEGYSGSIGSATGEEDKSKCLQQPKVSKVCKVNKPIQKGARKWVTVFVIEPTFGGWGHLRQEHSNFTQGQAIARAKELALQHQTEFEVNIIKRLAKGTAQIAVIAPKKSQKGKWLFTGLARC